MTLRISTFPVPNPKLKTRNQKPAFGLSFTSSELPAFILSHIPTTQTTTIGYLTATFFQPLPIQENPNEDFRFFTHNPDLEHQSILTGLKKCLLTMYPLFFHVPQTGHRPKAQRSSAPWRNYVGSTVRISTNHNVVASAFFILHSPRQSAVPAARPDGSHG